MRKAFLVLLAIPFAVPMLSGCFYYPYHYDGYGRGHRHHGGDYEDRDYDRRGDGQRDYDRDYRDRR